MLCLNKTFVYFRKTKDSAAKLTQLKRNQQTEKKNSAQMLEEARTRENQMTEDMTKLQVMVVLFLGDFIGFSKNRREPD